MPPSIFGGNSKKNQVRQQHRERLADERALRQHVSQRAQLREDQLNGAIDLPDIDGNDDAYYDYEYENDVIDVEPGALVPDAPRDVRPNPNWQPANQQLVDDPRVQGALDEIAELRGAIRTLVNEQSHSREVMQTQEATIAQLTLALEQSKKDFEQSAEARALDENRTRQQLEDLQEHIDSSTRPLRSLQAHMTDLLEQQRRKTDDVSQNQERYTELANNIEHITAVNDRSNALVHGLRDTIDNLKSEIDELRRDLIRTDDSVKIVDQESRRRVTESTDTFGDYQGKLDELRSDLAHAFELVEDTRRGLVHVDPSLEELRSGAMTFRQEVKKSQSDLEERLDQFVDKHDDERQEVDARFDQLRHAIDERIERLNERLDEANEVYRETTYKISELAAGIEDLKQVDASLHRDVWYLHEQRVRVRLEQVQEELDVATAQRRDAESEGRVGLGNRIRRRRSGDDSTQ